VLFLLISFRFKVTEVQKNWSAQYFIDCWYNYVNLTSKVEETSLREQLTLFLACSKQSGSSWQKSKTGTQHWVLSANLAVQCSNSSWSTLYMMCLMQWRAHGRATPGHASPSGLVYTHFLSTSIDSFDLKKTNKRRTCNKIKNKINLAKKNLPTSKTHFFFEDRLQTLSFFIRFIYLFYELLYSVYHCCTQRLSRFFHLFPRLFGLISEVKQLQ